MPARTELIEEIKARTDLVALIGEYVPLRRSGRRHVGLCPFHQESSPSFSVNEEGRFFYCFGCKASGDAYEFIMRLEGLDFAGAARFLAERVGLRWEAQTPEEAAREKKRAALLKLNNMAAELYRRALAAPQTGARAREYLRRRGIAEAAAARFGLGYAPGTGRALVGVLRKYGCRLEDAAAAGLVVPTADGYLDRFRDRIVFPLLDLRAQAVGFGGRTMGDAQPKYLNSPESEIFSKGRFLYGLYQAREAIRRAGYAVLVEGYFDVIVAHQAGEALAVAPLGTALTEGHAALLKRFTDKIVIAFDGDNAGQAATVRGLEILRRGGLNVYVAVMPPGVDPDDLIRGQGRDSFSGLVAAALPLTDFLLGRVLAGSELGNPEGRAAAVQACLPVLAEVAAGTARDGYLRKVAGQIHVHADHVAAALESFLRNRRKQPHKMDSISEDSNNNCTRDHHLSFTVNPAEKELLRVILKEYSLMARIREELTPEEFAAGPLREIYAELYGRREPFQTAEILAAVSPAAREILIELLAESGMDKGPPLRSENLPKCIRRVKAGSIRRRLLEIEAALEALQEKPGEEARVVEYQRQQQALLRERDKYRDITGFEHA
ncbi:MAG: DNA primase [Patescibacteria group bacterium]